MANQFPRVIKFTIFYLVSLSFSKQAFTQINVNYTCNEKVLMWYEKNVYPIDSINNEVFEVFFNSGFKDSAIVYINGTELFSGYLITDPRLSFARNLSFINSINASLFPLINIINIFPFLGRTKHGLYNIQIQSPYMNNQI